MVELLFQTNNPRSVGAWLNVKAHVCTTPNKLPRRHQSQQHPQTV